MNIQSLLMKQKELNDYIIKTRGLTFNEGELLKNMILACHDEISEVAENPQDSSEYIDVLHFILSIMIELGYSGYDEFPPQLYPSKKLAHIELRELLLEVTRLSKCFKHWSDKKPSVGEITNIRELLLDCIDIIYTECKYLQVDMYEEYEKKYQINIERQKNGY